MVEPMKKQTEYKELKLGNETYLAEIYQTIDYHGAYTGINIYQKVGGLSSGIYPREEDYFTLMLHIYEKPWFKAFLKSKPHILENLLKDDECSELS